MQEEAIRRQADRLYWRRCRPLLAGPPIDPVVLGQLYQDCLAEARRDTALDTAQDGLGLLVAKLAVIPLEYKDLPAGPGWWQRKDGDTADDSVVGYLAVFDNLDLGKDIIHPGAFTKTVGEARAFAATHKSRALYPLLWQHQKDEPIGAITQAGEDTHGLKVRCHINREIDHGKQAYDGLRGGYLSFSIGYKPVKYEWEGKVRHLHEIALAEGSVVTFPMNPEARSIAA
jgi:HK97 family phage prohead protease